MYIVHSVVLILASTVHICIGPSIDINVNIRCDFHFSLLVSWPSYFAEIDHIRPEPTHSTHQEFAKLLSSS